MLVYVNEDEWFEFYNKHKSKLKSSCQNTKRGRGREFNYKSEDGIIRAQVVRYCSGKKYLIDKGYSE